MEAFWGNGGSNESRLCGCDSVFGESDSFLASATAWLTILSDPVMRRKLSSEDDEGISREFVMLLGVVLLLLVYSLSFEYCVCCVSCERWIWELVLLSEVVIIGMEVVLDLGSVILNYTIIRSVIVLCNKKNSMFPQRILFMRFSLFIG